MVPTLKRLNEEMTGLSRIENDDQVLVSMVCNMKTQYAYLKCKYADCKFEHWFNYRQGSEKLRQIRYARSINSNHSIRAHQEAKLKTL